MMNVWVSCSLVILNGIHFDLYSSQYSNVLLMVNITSFSSKVHYRLSDSVESLYHFNLRSLTPISLIRTKIRRNWPRTRETHAKYLIESLRVLLCIHVVYYGLHVHVYKTSLNINLWTHYSLYTRSSTDQNEVNFINQNSLTSTTPWKC